MKEKFVSTYVHFVSGTPSSFEEYLSSRRDAATTKILPLRFGGYLLFYPQDPAIAEVLEELEAKNEKLLKETKELPAIAETELLRSCLVEEIIQTNQIEGVFSTRKDIYRILDDVSVSKKQKIRSLVNKYELLLRGEPASLRSLEDIRAHYDSLMEDALDPKDAPDGELFRKGTVSVTDGARTLHNGLYPEQKIQEALKVFLDVSKEKDLSPWERLYVAHYIFEYAHPFYDGNGRTGRYLMTVSSLSCLPRILAFRLATAIGRRKQRYYKAFSETQDIRNRGDLSTFVYPNLVILLEEYDILLDDISLKKERSLALSRSLAEAGVSLEEDPVLKTLAETTAFASFGIRIEDIASATALSIPTVNRRLKEISLKGWLIKEKNGYQSYFRLNEDAIL